MRIAISSSCLTVIILLLVMIHCSIINKNYREMEVSMMPSYMPPIKHTAVILIITKLIII